MVGLDLELDGHGRARREHGRDAERKNDLFHGQSVSFVVVGRVSLYQTARTRTRGNAGGPRFCATGSH